MEKLFLSHWLPNVETLGPSKRMGIWFSGCNKNCTGCAATKLKSRTGAVQCDPLKLASFVNAQIEAYHLDGLTISGGDPLEQPLEAFAAFLKGVAADDILLYTGFDLGEVKRLPVFHVIASKVAVLKCGRYISALDAGEVLRGSTNQTFVYYKEKYRQVYQNYMQHHGRALQVFVNENEVIYAGLPENPMKNL